MIVPVIRRVGGEHSEIIESSCWERLAWLEMCDGVFMRRFSGGASAV